MGKKEIKKTIKLYNRLLNPNPFLNLVQKKYQMQYSNNQSSNQLT